MRSTPIITALKLVGVGVWLVVIAVLPPWLSGDWRWVEGWILGVWLAVFIAGSGFWLYYKDPALLAERMRMPGTGGESRFDLVILIGVKLVWVAWMVLPALDVRFGWTTRLPLWSEVCGGVLLFAGSVFMFRAVADNTFASQLVRIQTERGQHVIDTGVYRFVRHPMYLGGSLMLVGGGLLLGSIVGLVIGIGEVLLLVVRIFIEEKLLVRDLAGYQEYRRNVRYRLVPHVW